MYQNYSFVIIKFLGLQNLLRNHLKSIWLTISMIPLFIKIKQGVSVFFLTNFKTLTPCSYICTPFFNKGNTLLTISFYFSSLHKLNYSSFLNSIQAPSISTATSSPTLIYFAFSKGRLISSFFSGYFVPATTDFT